MVRPWQAAEDRENEHDGTSDYKPGPTKRTAEPVLVRQRLIESLMELGHVVKAEKQRDQRDREPLPEVAIPGYVTD